MANVLFSKESLDKALEENKKDVKQANRVLIPAGFHILELTTFELKKTDKTQDPMFVIGVSKADDKKEEFREVLEFLPIMESGLQTRNGVNLNFYNVVAFLTNCFGEQITSLDETDPLGDLEKRGIAHLHKKLRGIIGHEKHLNKDYNKEMISATFNNFTLRIAPSRFRALSDTTLNENIVKPKDLILELPAKQKAILEGRILPDEYKKAPVNSAPPVTDAFGAPEITDTDPNSPVNKLPF
jgi:hypothetical protein